MFIFNFDSPERILHDERISELSTDKQQFRLRAPM